MHRSDLIIEAGIIFLLIYTPLAFGGVSQGSIALMEGVIGGLCLVWLLKSLLQRHRTASGRQRDAQTSTLQVIVPSCLLPLILFLGLGLFQFVPLPGALVQLISPTTSQLYADAANHVGTALPAWLPLSVCAPATAAAWRHFLAYCLLFVLTINTIRSPRQVRRIIFVIVAVGLLEALYGLLEYFSGRHQIFFYQKQSSFSVSGTFINKNHFAGYMEMVIPMTIGVLFARLKERSPAVSKKIVRFLEEKYMKALLVGFLLIVMCCALLLSGSRGGLIGSGGSMACLIWLTYRRRLLRKSAVLLLILLLITMAVSLLIGHELIFARLQAFTDLQGEMTFRTRLRIWRDMLPLWQDFPIFGSGLGTFAHIFPAYQRFPSEVKFFHAENDYLQLLVETGLLGGLLVIWTGLCYAFTTLRAWQQRRSRWSIIVAACGMSALVSIGIHSSVDFNLHIPSNALLFTIIAALTAVAAHSRRRTHKS